MITSRITVPAMKSVSDRIYGDNQDLHFMFNNFFSENRAVYEIMWEKGCRAGQAIDDSIHRAWSLHAV